MFSFAWRADDGWSSEGVDTFEFAQEEKFASAVFTAEGREFRNDRSRLAEFSH